MIITPFGVCLKMLFLMAGMKTQSMYKSVRHALEAHVADNPVFVFFHEDGQVEVFTSYPYLSDVEGNVEAATKSWLTCIEE